MGANAFDDLKTGLAAAKDALLFLSRFQIIPSPENYVLAYHFASGLNAALVSDVQSRLLRTNALTQTDFNNLRKTHLNDKNQTETSTLIVDGAAYLVNSIMEQVADAIYSSKSFGTKVSVIERKLTEPKPDLNAIVGELLAAISESANRNAELEAKLKQSADEVHGLQHRLDEARSDATLDVLTGLQNRRAFDGELLTLTSQARNSGKPLVLLMLDADHFKRVNDTYGHQTGDQVLRVLAQVCADNLKDYGTVSRYGGEEFAAILPGVGAREANTIADRVRHSVEQRRIVDRPTGREIEAVTISIGWTAYKPGEAIEEFLSRADKALYRAKSAGRNCVRGESIPLEPLRKY